MAESVRITEDQEPGSERLTSTSEAFPREGSTASSNHLRNTHSESVLEGDNSDLNYAKALISFHSISSKN